LVPISQEIVHVEDLDFSQVKLSAGDLSASALNDILSNETMCHKVCGPAVDIVGDRQTLVFASGVQQAYKMAEIFNRHKPGSAHAIVGATDKEERKYLLQAYSRREFQFLCGCGVFTEGFDEPNIECIVMARPTKSRSMYAQMAGRGTRVLPNVIEGDGTPPAGWPVDMDGDWWRISSAAHRVEAIHQSGKKNVLLIDFTGNAGRHKLVHAADLLGGEYSDEVIAEATKSAKASKEAVDVALELKKAAKVIADQKAEKLKKLVASAKYKRRSVSPFDVFDIPTPREPGWHKGRMPTDSMLGVLRRAKVPLTYDQGKWWICNPKQDKDERIECTFWVAKQTIDQIMNRRKEGLCTYAQAQILKRYNLSTDVGFKEASGMIDKIAKNGWKRPKGM